jgi:uncharacterized lipoprotein YmbA
MKKLVAILQVIIVSIICLSLFGCFSPKYMKRQQYLLNSNDHPCYHDNHYTRNVLLHHVTVASQFDQMDFIYRVSDMQYVTDYYNGFMAPIGQQLDSAELSYFREHAHFYPVTSDDLADADIVLNTHVAEMYADYRDRVHPCAVVSMHVVMIHKTSQKQVILLDRTFCTRVFLPKKDTSSLLTSLRAAIQCDFAQVVAACNKVAMQKN